MEESILKLHDKNSLKHIALGKGLSHGGFNGRNISRMRKQDFIDFILLNDRNEGSHNLMLHSSLEEDIINILQELVTDDTFQPLIHIMNDALNMFETNPIFQLNSEAQKEPQERVPNEEDEILPNFIIEDLVIHSCDSDLECEICQKNKRISEENLKVKTNLKNFELKTTCVICRNNVRNTVFSPCNHMATCISCSKNALLAKKCPLCRKIFNNTFRIFY